MMSASSPIQYAFFSTFKELLYVSADCGINTILFHVLFVGSTLKLQVQYVVLSVHTVQGYGYGRYLKLFRLHLIGLYFY